MSDRADQFIFSALLAVIAFTIFLLVGKVIYDYSRCETLQVMSVGGCNDRGNCGVIALKGDKMVQGKARFPVAGGDYEVCK